MKNIRKNEDSILRSLYTLPYATGKQINRLLYSEGSYRTTLELLKGLFDKEMVDRKALPSQIRAGSVPFVYWLSTQGRNYLESLGYDFSTWQYPSEMKLAQSSHLWACMKLCFNSFKASIIH